MNRLYDVYKADIKAFAEFNSLKKKCIAFFYLERFLTNNVNSDKFHNKKDVQEII